MMKKNHDNFSYRFITLAVAVSFLTNPVFLPISMAQIHPETVADLPTAGTMILNSEDFTPVIVKGVTIDPENPLRFDFIVDTGDTHLAENQFTQESYQLIKYFLASLTIPEDEMWVNLSPYEQERIIPDGLGVTEMGRDLLAQDYLLKQVTASLAYPADDLGKEFWNKVYQRAQQLYGPTEIPINTFNKVWIVPDHAVVYEEGSSAYVVESHLKVMLEEDYLTMQHSLENKQYGTQTIAQEDVKAINNVSSAVVRDVLIPAIEKEVNEG